MRGNLCMCKGGLQEANPHIFYRDCQPDFDTGEQTPSSPELQPVSALGCKPNCSPSTFLPFTASL